MPWGVFIVIGIRLDLRHGQTRAVVVKLYTGDEIANHPRTRNGVVIEVNQSIRNQVRAAHDNTEVVIATVGVVVWGYRHCSLSEMGIQSRGSFLVVQYSGLRAPHASDFSCF